MRIIFLLSQQLSVVIFLKTSEKRRNKGKIHVYLLYSFTASYICSSPKTLSLVLFCPFEGEQKNLHSTSSLGLLDAQPKKKHFIYNVP